MSYLAALGATDAGTLYKLLKELRDKLVLIPPGWQGKFLQTTPWTDPGGVVHTVTTPTEWVEQGQGSNVVFWPAADSLRYTAAWRAYVALKHPPGREKLEPLLSKPPEALYNVNYALWRLQPAEAPPPVKPLTVRMAGFGGSWLWLLGVLIGYKFMSGKATRKGRTRVRPLRRASRSRRTRRRRR